MDARNILFVKYKTSRFIPLGSSVFYTSKLVRAVFRLDDKILDINSNQFFFSHLLQSSI